MFDNLSLALFNTGEETVRLSRRNLNLTGFSTKGRKTNNTKDLSKGLGFKISEKGNKRILEYTSKENYASYIDQGVNGQKKKYGSKFSYKTGTRFANLEAIEKYVRSPKVRLRRTKKTEAGTKVSEPIQKNEKNIMNTTFAMASRIPENGIKPTLFFTKAAAETKKNIPTEYEEAIRKDMEFLLIQGLEKNSNITAKLI